MPICTSHGRYEGSVCPTCAAQPVTADALQETGGTSIVSDQNQAMVRVLPKAGLPRRFAGDGLELITLYGLEVVGAIAAFFTLGISGIVSSVIGATYMAIKDLAHGKFSVGKLIARTRVVDAKTAELATAKQAVLRNSYYVAGWLLAALPDPIGYLGWAGVSLAILVDSLMVLASPSGRRIGDYIAGTQVVPISVEKEGDQ